MLYICINSTNQCLSLLPYCTVYFGVYGIYICEQYKTYVYNTYICVQYTCVWDIYMGSYLMVQFKPVCKVHTFVYIKYLYKGSYFVNLRLCINNRYCVYFTKQPSLFPLVIVTTNILHRIITMILVSHWLKLLKLPTSLWISCPDCPTFNPFHKNQVLSIDCNDVNCAVWGSKVLTS